MPRVFISYRRQDSSADALNLYESLCRKLGKESVFFDIDSIPFGVDFRRHINTWVSRAEIVLVVIGNYWLDSRNEQDELRLQNPTDFVRLEIETAFRLKKCVVPVLVAQAGMPSPAALPKSLEDLAYQNAAEVRVGREYRQQLEGLSAWLVDWKPEVQDRARTELITNSIGMQLKLILAGEFMMGSVNWEESAASSEKPQHQVRITKRFYLGIYPVTQRQYGEVMGVNPSSFAGNPTCPVESVSWREAVAFCRRLSEREGRPYRLPKEAEWEYACRADTQTTFSFGDDGRDLGEYAWFYGNSGSKTHPVGEKRPNAWGLHDMHGNVWEWCADWYSGDYYAESPRVDPRGPSRTWQRVIRGGGWAGDAESCRAACRDADEPAFRDHSLGFRVAVDAPGAVTAPSTRRAEPGA